MIFYSRGISVKSESSFVIDIRINESTLTDGIAFFQVFHMKWQWYSQKKFNRSFEDWVLYLCIFCRDLILCYRSGLYRHNTFLLIWCILAAENSESWKKFCSFVHREHSRKTWNNIVNHALQKGQVRLYDFKKTATIKDMMKNDHFSRFSRSAKFELSSKALTN